MKNFKRIGIVLVLGIIITLGLFYNKVADQPENGEFHIKRAWVTGHTAEKNIPQMYWVGLGRKYEFKEVATIGFGKEVGEGSADIDAISVMFNDGSTATNSGLVRIKLPEPGSRKPLLENYAEGYDHFIRAGVVPVVRNAVRMAANLRNAQDAYTTLALYQQAVKDQLENGLYLSEAAIDTIINATGDVEYKQITKIKLGPNGLPMREPNSLQELGCIVTECVIDIPVFDDAVIGMINKRKDEAMKTELAKQAALRAKQDAITAEQQGLANVATAKYEREVELVKQVTDARKDFEVEEFNAKKALETAKKIRAEGDAKAAANRALVAAGLTPQQEMDMKIKIAEVVSKNVSGAATPQVVIVGGDSKGGSGAEEALKVFGAERAIELINKVNTGVAKTK